MTEILSGSNASDGITIGKVFKMQDVDLNFEEYQVDDIDGEINRFYKAVYEASQDLKKMTAFEENTSGKYRINDFSEQIEILENINFHHQITDYIQEHEVNAEAAVYNVNQTRANQLNIVHSNRSIQERAIEIEDLTRRILAKLLNDDLPEIGSIDQEVVVVARELTPSDTAQLNVEYIKGIVVERGNRTSHSALMARQLGIPAIVGVKGVFEKLDDGDFVIVDALAGDLYINPNFQEVEDYHDKIRDFDNTRSLWLDLAGVETYAKDGEVIKVLSNISSPVDAEAAMSVGSDGIGLYRTEFLFMVGNQLPDEEEQFQAYKEVLEVMGDKPVCIRKVDIGADKNIPNFPVQKEDNPALGYRAIRLAMDKKDLFKVHLRALLRASVYGNLKISLPMIATVAEFKAAKRLVEEVRSELMSEGHAVSNDIEIGMMVEVPSAAILVDQFVEEVDFFSIGTNDLIQYVMAADRLNPKVDYLYQTNHPSILRLLGRVIQVANKAGKPISMCGEMAENPISVPLLLGMGLRKFSMSTGSILKMKYQIEKLSIQETKKLWQKVEAEAITEEDVGNMVHAFLEEQDLLLR